ncbi:hypothetical protein INR49_020431 [Caranx melampygus]|nr:hypothetical protein INR49_020431 [Caranx melampygus]
MEDEELDDVLDDWFIESLKTYKDLHVYQLEHPTQVMEWTSGKTVCVAGHTSCRNEILELRLPPKLFAHENKGLCAERDFKVVHGGFTDTPVRSLAHVPGTRFVVTSEGRSSDLQPQILHGAQSDDVELTELISGQTLFTLDSAPSNPLTSLQFVSDGIFLAGCSNGNVLLADTRTSSSPPQLSAPPPSPSPGPGPGPGESVLWWTSASSGPDPSSCRVFRLSSSGQALVSDLRSPGVALSWAQLDLQTRHHGLDQVKVSWAPALDQCVAVSGFNAAIQIYSTSSWGAELQEARPLFEHRGHAVSSQPSGDDSEDDLLVTSHLWHRSD